MVFLNFSFKLVCKFHKVLPIVKHMNELHRSLPNLFANANYNFLFLHEKIDRRKKEENMFLLLLFSNKKKIKIFNGFATFNGSKSTSVMFSIVELIW